MKKDRIIAKKISKVYRLVASSSAFAFTGLDYDLIQAEQEDKADLLKVNDTLRSVRRSLK